MPDPLRDLIAALPGAAGGTLLAGLLAAHPAGLEAWPLACGLGLLAGWLMPCTSGAIALAAALRHVVPAASAGILLSAGIIPRRWLGMGLVPWRLFAAWFMRLNSSTQWRRHCRAAADNICAEIEGDHAADCGTSAGYGASTDRWALGGVGLACGWLVARGGAGFVHPRLVPLVAAGCVLALARLPLALRSRSISGVLVVPGVLLTALVFGSPVPSTSADETTLDGAYAGERVSFIGTATRRNGATVLVRYAITCCRADAMPVALRLDRVPRRRKRSMGPRRWQFADDRVRPGSAGRCNARDRDSARSLRVPLMNCEGRCRGHAFRAAPAEDSPRECALAAAHHVLAGRRRRRLVVRERFSEVECEQLRAIVEAVQHAVVAAHVDRELRVAPPVQREDRVAGSDRLAGIVLQIDLCAQTIGL